MTNKTKSLIYKLGFVASLLIFLFSLYECFTRSNDWMYLLAVLSDMWTTGILYGVNWKDESNEADD